MALAGMAGSLFLWRKGDDMREFAILGMLVACSLFVAIGWIDRRRVPFLKRSGPPGSSIQVGQAPRA
jgi:ABC-type sulfate transport system permease subunit